MKKFFTILITLLVISGAVEAQFQVTKIRQATFKGDIRSFSYKNNVLFVVGYNLGVVSFVKKSYDLGNTWEDISGNFGAGDNLTAISFIDQNVGLVAGASGKIYRTTDGGATWTNVSPITFYTGGINHIVMLNNNLVYACGANSTNYNVIKSTDGGVTWQGVNTGNTNTMYKMYWKNSLEGIIVGASGKYIRTSDGGTTWYVATVPGSTAALYDIVRADENTFYATGTTGILAKSTDGGASFTNAGIIANTTFYTLYFKDPQVGVALGSNGVCYRTTNGGANWILIDSFTSEVIRTSIFIDNNLIAGAYRSTIIKSTDYGVTWVNLANSMRDMYGINVDPVRKHIVISGDRGEVNYSPNMGIDWIKTNFTIGDILYDVVKIWDNIYTCGRLGAFFVSTNNGQTWINRSNGSATTRIYKLFFFDMNTGYAVTNEGKVLYTTDAGVTWVEKAVFASTTLYDIKMLNAITGFATGSGDRLFATTDGLNWAHGEMARPNGQVTGIYMLDNQKGYITSENGAVYKTTDGFRTIQLMTDTLALAGKIIHDVYAFDENNVYAVGQGGIILRTVTPDQMVVATILDEQQDLLDMAVYDNSTLLISGGNGLVYKLTDFAVPVNLVSFDATVHNNNVILTWKTATETNNSGFEIQRKTNNSVTWDKVTFINGKGSSTEPSEYKFIDENLQPNKYFYRLKQVDLDGSYTYYNVVEVDVNVNPLSLALEQNYPNPFNPVTNIKFSIPEKQFVTLKIFDILGKEITTLVNEELMPGVYTKQWNAENLSSGIYFYTITTNKTTLSKKMNLIK